MKSRIPYSDRLVLAEKAIREGRRNEHRIRASCPFCASVVGTRDKHAAFRADLRSGFFRCYRCGTAGRLPGYEGDDWKLDVPEDAREEVLAPPDGYVPLGVEPGATSLFYARARAYLQKERRVPRATAVAARIGAIATGKHGGRIVVPVLSPDGDWLAWIGRAYVPTLFPRYWHEGSRHVLYNHAALLVESDEPAILGEGVFDALPYWPDGVALLGKDQDHYPALLAAKRPIAVALDGDAWEQGWAMTAKLRFDGVRCGAVRLPPKTDPGNVDPGWLREEARRSLDAPL